MKLSVATTARREIAHKPKQKTLLGKQLGKTQWSNTRCFFLRMVWYHDVRCGIEESRVRGGRRRARRPHASKLLRESAKAEATKVARTSGGRAISRERRGKSAGGGRPTSAGAITKGN